MFKKLSVAFLFLNPFFIYLSLLFVSVILLFVNSVKSKRAAWIIALVSSLLFLLNPFSSSNPFFSQGVLIMLIQTIFKKHFLMILLVVKNFISAFFVILFSLVELLKARSKILDRVLGVLFVVLFCLSLFFENVLRFGTCSLRILIPFVFFIIFVVVLLVWGKIEKHFS
ncbi:hypothetical protein DRJ22_00775 [Candidatus Woesearchaeota archaeon]|nr:MAG: hypothetical protein DRJ22_00775 [Candidatus Woesearchaeota archaeon]